MTTMSLPCCFPHALLYLPQVFSGSTFRQMSNHAVVTIEMLHTLEDKQGPKVSHWQAAYTWLCSMTLGCDFGLRCMEVTVCCGTAACRSCVDTWLADTVNPHLRRD